MRSLTYATLTAAILMTMVVSGCKEGGPSRASSTAQGGPCVIRVAIVPFDGMGLSEENAARVVTEEVLTTLMGTGLFDVVEPGMVYSALAETGARNAWGIDPATMQKVEDKIGPVDCFVVGTVQEFGEVHVGSLSYPSISVSARVLEPESGKVLWSGSASRTGAESEKLFGMGAVHSPGRLARAVVQQLITCVPAGKLLAELKRPQPQPGTVVALPVPPKPGPPTGLTGKEKFMDETATVSEAVLKGYLVDFDGFTRGEVTFRTHHFSIAEVTYEKPNLMVAVKLEDCGKKDVAAARIHHNHPDDTDGRFAGLPAYESPSSARLPGAFHLDLAAGRFALFLTGPESRKSEIENLAQAILAAMK